jgi:plastocyanin
MRRWMATIAAAILVAGCGGGDGPAGNDGIASVTINAPSLTMLQGETAQLEATAKDVAGNSIPGAPAATWSSSNTNVASVSATGLVTAAAPGSTDVTATIGGRRSTATRVTVGVAPNSVTVTMPGLSFAPFHAVVRKDGRVNFEFPAQVHNVIFETKPGAPADIQQTSSVTVSRQFGTLGLFKYDCRLHNGMVGEVEVVE